MWVIIGVVLALAAGWVAVRIDGKRNPRPMAMRWEQFFLDNPVRRRFFGPAVVLAHLGAVRGLKIGEIGVGVGVVTEALTVATGENGKVWGIDVQPDAVRRTRRRLGRAQLSSRAKVVVADGTALPWPDSSLDRIVMVAVLGEVPPADRYRVLQEVLRVLGPHGKLVITEFWPDPHYIAAPRLAQMVTRAGFRVEGTLGNRWIYTTVAIPWKPSAPNGH